MNEDIDQSPKPTGQFFSNEHRITCFSFWTIQCDVESALVEASWVVAWVDKELKHWAFIFIFMELSSSVGVSILY
jgi:hypothetical protein